MIYRGSVVKINDKDIVVMTENNTFEKIKKFEGLEEGMEVYFEKQDIIKNKKSHLNNIPTVAAAIFLLVFTSIYGISFWNTNYEAIALVSVDINPSVEIELNKNHKVIKALPINEDATNLPLHELKNKPLVDALNSLVQMTENEGYIKSTEKNYVVVTAVQLEDNSENSQSLEQFLAQGKIKIENDSKNRNQDIEVVTIESNKEMLDAARKENISVGKMEMYENAKNTETDNDVLDIQEFKNTSVKELIEKTKKEHPVFEEHPSNNKNKDKQDEKEHPVFDKHPGNNKSKNKDEEVENNPKDHPVFKEHPKDRKEKEHPVFDKHPSNNKNKDKQEEKFKDNKKDHPVFKNHPKNKKSN